MVNCGGGLKYFLNENIAFRGDVRHVLSFDGDDTYNNLLYTVGITFLFGGQKEKVRAEAAKVVEAPKSRVVGSLDVDLYILIF